jgi:FkbM family methyltransferase
MNKLMLRRFLLTLGWDVHRHKPANTDIAQLLAAIKHAQSNIIFDIGANVGQFSQLVRSIGFTGKIVSFEPLSSAHAKLSNAANFDPLWVAHPRVAVGNSDGEIVINIAGNSWSSSVLPMLEAHSSAAPGSVYVSSEITPIVRLDSVAKQYLREDSRLFIKIDTQGFEWQVLDGARETLKVAQGVVLELSLVPLYDGQVLWREIINRLETEGFTLWAFQKGFTDPLTGRSLQLDAIFLRA